MSEYQYYRFLALDRSLSEADRKALRALSGRAEITATSFTNTYEWGDFKGDPKALVERWFDLHLYLANWGTRRLMIRWPKHVVDRHALEHFLGKVDCATLRIHGDHLILDIFVEEVEPDDDVDDDSGWLDRLAPLRADVMNGDLRLFYLLWLQAAVDDGRDDEAEPAPGIGPLTGPLAAFADFFGLDADLVCAAAERVGPVSAGEPSHQEIHAAVAAMSEGRKLDMLVRLHDGDTVVGHELRAHVRAELAKNPAKGLDRPGATARTVGELRARVEAIEQERARAAAKKTAADQKRRDTEAAKARRVRLDALAGQGEAAWRRLQAEIARAYGLAYDRATATLLDLKVLAEERGTATDFHRRVAELMKQHARKPRFIERLRHSDLGT